MSDSARITILSKKPQNGVKESSPGKGSPGRGNASRGKDELVAIQEGLKEGDEVCLTVPET